MTILVSGGTGLVGRYIVEGFLTSGQRVVVGARRAPAADIFSRPVDFVPMHLDPDVDQAQAFEGIETFVHAAFDHLPGKYRGGEGRDPARFRRLNLDGSFSLFETAKRSGVRHCIFLSSRAVYDGTPPGTELVEEMALLPTSLYGEIKLACEDGLAALAGPHFITASLRATGVYGALRPNKWDSLIADASAGLPIAPRAGTEVHGEDVAQAIRLLLSAAPETVSGRSFNLSDVAVDTRTILEHLRLPADLVALATLSANVMNTDRMRRLGWTPGGTQLFEKTMAQLAASLDEASRQ